MHTNKKNQHYIPKFYLRNFSVYRNGKQLGIFNTDSNFFHNKAPLKSQGSKNFFYGYDGKIEDALSEIESLFATILNEIIRTKCLPIKQSNGHKVLLMFIVLTDLRNPISIETIQNSSAQIKKILFELSPDSELAKSIPEIPHLSAVEIALSTFEGIVNITNDLEYKLIINTTETPFISSDFPIVKYNQYLEAVKWPHGREGYSTAGLQIFIPISPQLAIIFFDSNVYKVGNKKDQNLSIENKNDIDSLNTLQIVNCNKILFFDEHISETYIKRLNILAQKHKKANRLKANAHYLQTEENIDPQKKNLIKVSSTNCEINLQLQNIKFLSGIRKKKLPTTVTYTREHWK